MENSKAKVVYLTNCPSPYRERMHERLAENSSISYSVIYCTELEPNRNWTFRYGKYDKYFLSKASKGYRHNHPDVWKLLNSINPEVLIVTAFSPTMLYGILWVLMNKKKFVIFIDGTYDSEKQLTKVHRLVRRFAFKKAKAFLAPGIGTIQLYKSYSVPESIIFKSCLCVDNSLFKVNTTCDREFHIMFSGRITESKMPLFFVEVAKKLNKKIRNFRILVVGDGDQRSAMLKELTRHGIDFVFTGFLAQECLPIYYTKSKLFLFPTMGDTWGVVANEACASGTPVITCPLAGVSNDLIIHRENGFILPLDVDLWSDHAMQLLTDESLLQSFSLNAQNKVQSYNHQQSVDGIMNALDFTFKS